MWSSIYRTSYVVLMVSLGVMYGFLVCRLASFRGASPHDWVGGKVEVSDYGEILLVNVLVPCCMDDLCRCCHMFGQLVLLLVCW